MSDDWTPKPASGRPAQPYELGNLESLRHGSHSERLVAPLADRHRLAVPKGVPSLVAHVLARLVEAQARTQARIELVQVYLNSGEVGELDAAGEPRPAARHLTSLERLNKEHLTAIVRVVADLATAGTAGNLEAMVAEGRRILRKAEERNERDAQDPEDAA